MKKKEAKVANANIHFLRKSRKEKEDGNWIFHSVSVLENRVEANQVKAKEPSTCVRQWHPLKVSSHRSQPRRGPARGRSPKVEAQSYSNKVARTSQEPHFLAPSSPDDDNVDKVEPKFVTTFQKSFLTKKLWSNSKKQEREREKKTSKSKRKRERMMKQRQLLIFFCSSASSSFSLWPVLSSRASRLLSSHALDLGPRTRHQFTYVCTCKSCPCFFTQSSYSS